MCMRFVDATSGRYLEQAPVTVVLSLAMSKYKFRDLARKVKDPKVMEYDANH